VEIECEGLTAALLLSVPLLEKFILEVEVMSTTLDNGLSMLQDVTMGQMTDVRYLNGYIWSMGWEKHWIECPWNIAT